MTDSPEIKRLREQASSDGIYPTRWVTLAHAEQAVRDTEARHRAELDELYDAARQFIERKEVRDLAWSSKLKFMVVSRPRERTFLTPDNPEGT